jgi:FKBP-type peptidyl-prolyl cis-trans isomerase FkpA
MNIQKSKYAFLSIVGCTAIATFASCNNKTKENGTTQSDTTAKVVEKTASIPEDDSLFVKDASGLECKWVTHGTGTQVAAVGSFADINVIFKIGDSTLVNTYEQNNHLPVTQQITAPGMKGDFMEGVAKMKAGDSAVFRMLVDTFAARAHQPKPVWAKSGDYIRWEVKVVQVMTKEQMDAEEAKKYKVQNDADDKILQAYFKSHNIKGAKKTASGLYYTVSKAGSGAHPKSGQQVTVNYTGQNLKGEKFDSNVDPSFNHVEPFSFPLGQHSVIKGWEEAAALMNNGMKATFYLPSSMAYGAKGQGGKIGPNEILIFDIELLSFK